MESMIGKRVRVKPVRVLKESFHGQTGVVEAERKYHDHNGPYTMLDVKMDGTVATNGIDGHIVHGSVVLPSDCFEEIPYYDACSDCGWETNDENEFHACQGRPGA